MSLKHFFAVLMMAFAFAAYAQDQKPQLQAAPDPVTKPSMRPIIDAFARAGKSKLSTRVLVEYDESGRVLSATVDPSTHNRNLDNAIQAWVLGVQLKPGASGRGWLPIEMSIK